MKLDLRFYQPFLNNAKTRMVLYFMYKRCSIVAVATVILFSVYFSLANLARVYDGLVINAGGSGFGDSKSIRDSIEDDLQPVLQFTNLSWSESSIIFNRIERTGSRTLIRVMERLGRKYNYSLITSDDWALKYMGLEDQKALVHDVNKQRTPFVYERSVHYVHFPRFGSKQPAWVSLIRDPLRRIISLYYFKRYGDIGTRPNATDTSSKPGFDECVTKNQPECSLKNVFRVIPYFCGQSAGCRVPNKWALETAKKNVIENFKFVGVLEEMNTTFQVLEALLPQYFHGASRVYKAIVSSGIVDQFKSFPGVPPSEQALTKMKGRLALEYEFYEFVKERMATLKQDLIN
ncbi:uronyl 2-sulfotransferase-like [Glandiceps talaboti]